MVFFFFNDTATTEIYPLSLPDALPIFRANELDGAPGLALPQLGDDALRHRGEIDRSEEHTSELQSQSNLVCRLLLEKKKLLNLSDRHTYSSSSLFHCCLYHSTLYW